MNTKKLLLSLAAAAMLFGLASPATQAATPSQVEVLLHAKKIPFPDAKPFQDENGYVMVPIRFVSEALGAKVGYTKAGGSMAVSIQNAEHKVQMTVGQNAATVDGERKTYETKIILKQNRTFVPLRLVSEGLGQTVEWDKVSRWVWIGKKDALSLEDKGLKPVSLDPYRKWFAKRPDLLKDSVTEKPYNQALVFKLTDLPTSFIRDIYSIEPYTASKGASYLKVRSKTSSSAGNIFYLTKKGDVRYRNAIPSLTVDNGDGTRYSFYKVFSYADEDLHGIKDNSPLQLKDVEYIGFDAGEGYIPLMVNPWR